MDRTNKNTRNFKLRFQIFFKSMNLSFLLIWFSSGVIIRRNFNKLVSSNLENIARFEKIIQVQRKL